MKLEELYEEAVTDKEVKVIKIFDFDSTLVKLTNTTTGAIVSVPSEFIILIVVSTRNCGGWNV